MAERSVIVLGAGIAGLSAALPLLRDGFEVSVIDPLPPPGGASFGNAGLVSAETVVPIALPGMLQQVPKWLTDPLGPLSVRPTYLPRAASWLLRWIEAGRPGRVLAISDAMKALHSPTHDCWRSLLGESYDALIKVEGHLQLWDETEETATAAVERRLRERHGVESRLLSRDEVLALLPGLSPQAVGRAILIPGNGQTVSPARAVGQIVRQFEREGGRLLAERALKLLPGGGGWTVMTNIANHRAARVVVASGAWSDTLLEPLGISVPLETERGYHAALPAPSLSPRLPILHKTRGLGLTPMDGELRVAGTVEIAGRDRAPNEGRARILIDHARDLFPGLESGPPRLWMGCRPSTPDSLPILGPVAEHEGLFLCFGHGHFGMTGGPPSGRLVAALVAGRRPFLDPAPYSIARFGRHRGPVPAPAAAEEQRQAS